jgi:hypothetical protein
MIQLMLISKNFKKTRLQLEHMQVNQSVYPLHLQFDSMMEPKSNSEVKIM